MKALYETPEVERIEFAAMESIAVEGEAPGGTGGSNPSEDPGMGV